MLDQKEIEKIPVNIFSTSEQGSVFVANEVANLISHCACLELLSGVLKVRDSHKIQYHQMMLQMAERELNTRNSTRLTHRLRSTHF